MKKILFFLLLFVNLRVFFWDYFKETYPKYKRVIRRILIGNISFL